MEKYRKSRAFSQLTGNRNLPVMGFYNPLDHGKAQAAAIGIPGRVRLVKPVPDTGQVLRGDPNPIIFYKHLQIFVRFPGGHPYMAAWVP